MPVRTIAYAVALLIDAILKSLGLDRQIAVGMHISDLVAFIALMLGVGLCLTLGWDLARTRSIKASLDASSWAVMLASGSMTLAAFIYAFALYHQELFTKYIRNTDRGLLIVGSCVVGVLWFLCLSLLGILICFPSILISRFLHRTTVPTNSPPAI